MGAFSRYWGRIEFSPSFISDLVFSLLYILVTTHLYVASYRAAPSRDAIAFIALVVLVAQAAKVALMFSLDRRGGKAGLGQSHALVTCGVYRYSRNPAYLVTILQNGRWSLLLLLAIAGQPVSLIVVLVIAALPVLHFLVLDRLVIRREEINLAEWHPLAFATYASGVNRWIGRRRNAPQPGLSAATPQA